MKTIIMILIVVVFTTPLFAKEYKLLVNSEILFDGVVSKENAKRDPNAIGDKHLRNKAYGLPQIRSPYLGDVNKIAGKKEIKKVWGKEKLSLSDMKVSKIAKWSFLVYLSHYGKYYTKKTGKKPNYEVYARIHNGGPQGWRKWSTVKYGKDVAKHCQAHLAKGGKKNVKQKTLA